MGVEIYIKDFQEKFERNVRFYTSKVMIHHIPYELKSIEGIPKKVEKMILVDKFKNYMQNIFYDLHKALRSDGSDMVFGGTYLMALNIQDPFTTIEYEYVRYIIEEM